MFGIRVICRDCTGEDEMGCNDGLPWWHTDENFEPVVFETEEEAQTYLNENWETIEGGGSPWEASVERRP